MATRIPFRALSRLFLIGITALAVTACASVRPTASPPAGMASFVAPVFPGDTISLVAQRYGVAVDELLALNSVKDPNRRLARGQVRIPAYARPLDASPAQQMASPASPAAPVAAAAAPAASGPPAALTQPPRAPIESRSLAPLPVTPTPRNRAQVNAPAPPAAPPKAPPAVSSPAAMAVTPSSAMESSWYDFTIPEPPSAAAAIPQTERRFLWPVNGRVISPFGGNANGGRNDGINIAVSRGAPIHAAGSGEVTYVGNELKGYGNLILIRHENGFITAYAHAERVDVKRGDRVERGQVIGSAGSTGDVSQPQLHFELRHGTTPVDPMPYLVVPVQASGNRLAEGTR